jgi:hypothetical protein
MWLRDLEIKIGEVAVTAWAVEAVEEHEMAANGRRQTQMKALEEGVDERGGGLR